MSGFGVCQAALLKRAIGRARPSMPWILSTHERVRGRHHKVPIARGPCCNAGNYLYVAFVRASSSRCGVKSTMEANAGPPSGFALKLSRMAAFTLSRASAFAPM